MLQNSETAATGCRGDHRGWLAPHRAAEPAADITTRSDSLRQYTSKAAFPRQNKTCCPHLRGRLRRALGTVHGRRGPAGCLERRHRPLHAKLQWKSPLATCEAATHAPQPRPRPHHSGTETDRCTDTPPAPFRAAVPLPDACADVSPSPDSRILTCTTCRLGHASACPVWCAQPGWCWAHLGLASHAPAGGLSRRTATRGTATRGTATRARPGGF